MLCIAIGGCSLLAIDAPKGDVSEIAQVQAAIESEQLSMVTVFNKKTVGEGYANFRITALAGAKNGDLLALAEGRRVQSDHTKGPLVLRRSEDGGTTWPQHQVYHPGSFDYSSIVRLPNGDVGILGEFDFGVNGRFNDIRFVRAKLDWLLEK